MEIKSLSSVALRELTSAFNASFSDYIVKMQLTEEQLGQKIQADNIQMDLSCGAFDEGRLIAFVFNSSDPIHYPGVAYNAGTGVVPEFRKQGIAPKLYYRIFEHLKTTGFKEYVLEVITENHKAIDLYKSLGFQIARELGCYKGTPKNEKEKEVRVRQIESIDHSIATVLWNSVPAWQNSLGSIERDASGIRLNAIYQDDTLAGYCVVGVSTGRIHQIAVKQEYRNQGFGKSLINHANSINQGRGLFMLNVDHRDTATVRFLEQLGLEVFVKQYEMKKEL